MITSRFLVTYEEVRTARASSLPDSGIVRRRSGAGRVRILIGGGAVGGAVPTFADARTPCLVLAGFAAAASLRGVAPARRRGSRIRGLAAPRIVSGGVWTIRSRDGTRPRSSGSLSTTVRVGAEESGVLGRSCTTSDRRFERIEEGWNAPGALVHESWPVVRGNATDPDGRFLGQPSTWDRRAVTARAPVATPGPLAPPVGQPARGTSRPADHPTTHGVGSGRTAVPTRRDGRRPHDDARPTPPRGGSSEGAAISTRPRRRKHRRQGAQRVVAGRERGGSGDLRRGQARSAVDADGERAGTSGDRRYTRTGPDVVTVSGRSALRPDGRTGNAGP